jgi:hypothetical protein
MRSIIAWCIDQLPFEPRSRRAIAETLADWTHEQLEAPSRNRSTLASVRGVLAIVRVVSFALVRETTDFGWNRGLARRWGYVAALTIALAFVTVVPMIDAAGPQTIALALLGVPLPLLAVLPPAIFLVLAWHPVARVGPTAGTACFLCLITLVLAGWLVPFSSDLLNATLRSPAGPSGPESDLSSRLTPSQIALAVTGWSSLVGATAICAAAVARRSPLVSRWWLAGVPAIYAALIPVFTFTIGTSFLVFRSAGDPPEGFGPGIAAWTTTALLMAVALTYGRPASEPETPAVTK